MMMLDDIKVHYLCRLQHSLILSLEHALNASLYATPALHWQHVRFAGIEC